MPKISIKNCRMKRQWLRQQEILQVEIGKEYTPNGQTILSNLQNQGRIRRRITHGTPNPISSNSILAKLMTQNLKIANFQILRRPMGVKIVPPWILETGMAFTCFFGINSKDWSILSTIINSLPSKSQSVPKTLEKRIIL